MNAPLASIAQQILWSRLISVVEETRDGEGCLVH